MFHFFGALAEFERDLIRERTHAGLAAARARGRFGGRPKVLTDPKMIALAKQLHAGKQTDIATICTTLGISRSTLYRAFKDDETSSSRTPMETGSKPLNGRRRSAITARRHAASRGESVARR